MFVCVPAYIGLSSKTPTIQSTTQTVKPRTKKFRIRKLNLVCLSYNLVFVEIFKLETNDQVGNKAGTHILQMHNVRGFWFCFCMPDIRCDWRLVYGLTYRFVWILKCSFISCNCFLLSLSRIPSPLCIATRHQTQDRARQHRANGLLRGI